MKKFLIITCTFFLLSPAYSQEAGLLEIGKGAGTAWLFTPDSLTDKPLVVFFHGYGVSNPKCYGGWISELISKGYPVLFPKYQYGFEPPLADKFLARCDSSIQKTLRKPAFKGKSLCFIGHSMGGVLAANLALKYKRVESLLLVSPGHKKFSMGSNKKGYNGLDSSLFVMIITGEKDKVAGTTFTDFFMKNSVSISNNKKWHLHYQNNNEIGTKSKHREPLSPNKDFSTKKWNPVIMVANKIGVTDTVDKELFWPIFDFLTKVRKDYSIRLELKFEFEEITY